MLSFVRDTVIRWVFGGGIGGTFALRGIDWLTEESRKAIAREPVELSRAHLRPGDSFTVIARPPDTRKERKLAQRSAQLHKQEQQLSATTSRQRRAARNLRSAQKKLDRRRTGTARYRRALVAEKAAAQRFDKAMAPSTKLVKVRDEKGRVDEELDLRRELSFRRAAGRRSERVTVYDTTRDAG